MDRFKIEGGKRLKGEIRISGSKNSALPCLFATLLTDDPCELLDVPNLADIQTAVRLLETLGKRVSFRKGCVRVQADRPLTGKAPYDLVRRMRASVLVMGPLLARRGQAHVSLPGGCAIGARPIDFHLDGFEKMGVKIKILEGYVQAQTKALKGNRIRLPFPSVGATENLMMAASLAEGQTTLKNAAREPEIVDLGTLLKKMGATIEGLGTSTLVIQGEMSLKGVSHRVIPDRIEAGTFLIAAGMTKGSIQLTNTNGDHLRQLIKALRQTGMVLKEKANQISIVWKRNLKPVNVRTAVYPGFPTDMQAQWISLMTLIPGVSSVVETVFENRFLHIQELLRFGANIQLKGRKALIQGGGTLSGCTVMVSDLRAGAALVLAGLAAKGKTTVLRIYHLDRGYEKLEKKFLSLGARIKRVH